MFDELKKWCKSAGLVGLALCCFACPSAPQEQPLPDRGLEKSKSKARRGALKTKARSRVSDLQVGGNQKIEHFRRSKPLMMQIFADRRQTFYCGCRFSKKKRVDLASCGYQWRKNEKRARRVEWEHVVPAEAFGRSLRVWREGHPDCINSKGKPYKGRRCAKKVSKLFRRMEADLHNLQPAIGEVNGDRSNYSMQEIPEEVREYGECDVEIDKRKIEPTESIRGDVARTYFYMDSAYPGRGIVGKKRRKLFEAWDKADPIDEWERTRSQRAAKIQGNANPFVK